MKRVNCFLILIVMLIASISSNGFGQQWSDPIEISSGDTPDIDIDPNSGNLYILSMTNGVTITKVDPNGNILEQEIVPGTGSEQGGGRFGASVAVDSDGYPHVAYRYYEGDDTDGTPLYSAYYVKKTASGWQNSVKLSDRQRRGYVVRIDVDENNVAHIIQGFIFDVEIWGRVNYFRIANNTVNKQYILGTDVSNIFRGDDRIEITTRPGGYVYVVTGVPDVGGAVHYLVSQNGGDSFSNYGDIHHSDNYGRNGSVDLAVDDNGDVHICYGSSEDASRQGQPSVRYARFEGSSKVVDKAATPVDYLQDWKIGMGLGSIASSEDGQNIVIAFLEQPGGPLYTTMSQDNGASWQTPAQISSASGSDEGRNKQFIRSNGYRFYVVYPHNYKVYLRTVALRVNEAPQADAGGPYSTKEGTSVSFDASNSVDTDGSIVKYEWDWKNDGSYDVSTTSATYNYTYTDNFTGKAKLRVTDNEGSTATALADITISNVAPTAKAGGPYQGQINQNISFYGNATDPGSTDVLTYSWDLNFDSIYETSGKNVQASFSTGGAHKIVLRVADDDGGIGLDTTTVNIESQPPVVSAIPSQTVFEGSSFSTINLDNYVTDPDNDDSQISWQVRGNTNLNVSISQSRVATITAKDADWYGSETITFIASDPASLKDSTSTIFAVDNVNDAPVISNIGDRTTTEGNSFNPINLDDYVTDSDNNKAELTWSVTGNTKLIAQISNRVLTVSPPNNDWNGSEELTIKATDPEGLFDTQKVTFTVNGLNDPPTIASIPTQQAEVGQAFAPIILDNYVNDPDHEKSQLTWSYKGNSNLTVSIDQRVVSVTRAYTNWVGSETISFIATDPLGAADTAHVNFVSYIGNKPPIVSDIPDQSILEGQTFQQIYLDGYVTDDDNQDSEITWTAQGQYQLTVSIVNRIATITIPNEEWSGMEVVKFKATDPNGLKDSTTTLFTVHPVNDPPVLGEIPDAEFHEDDTLKITYAYLKSFVTDPDNEEDDFQFQISGTVNLSWYNDITSKMIIIYGSPNWFGTETISLKVLDGAGGFDTSSWKITVKNVPDVPLSFSTILPAGEKYIVSGDTIHFSWQQNDDPEGGSLIYQLSISDDGSMSHVIDQYNNIFDTTYSLIINPSVFSEGKFYWQVTAFNNVGFTKSNISTFKITLTGISEIDPNEIPKDYALMQNYPNPFNPETWITYQVPEPSQVIMNVYNSLGQEVVHLVQGEVNAGTHRIKWDASDNFGNKLPSGVYICRLKAGNKLFHIKMLLLQ